MRLIASFWKMNVIPVICIFGKQGGLGCFEEFAEDEIVQKGEFNENSCWGWWGRRGGGNSCRPSSWAGGEGGEGQDPGGLVHHHHLHHQLHHQLLRETSSAAWLPPRALPWRRVPRWRAPWPPPWEVGAGPSVGGTRTAPGVVWASNLAALSPASVLLPAMVQVVQVARLEFQAQAMLGLFSERTTWRWDLEPTWHFAGCGSGCLWETRGGEELLAQTLPHNPFHIVHHLYIVQGAVCVCACVSCAGYLGMNVLLEMCWWKDHHESWCLLKALLEVSFLI